MDFRHTNVEAEANRVLLEMAETFNRQACSCISEIRMCQRPFDVRLSDVRMTLPHLTCLGPMVPMPLQTPHNRLGDSSVSDGLSLKAGTRP
jgi:hypothetical protein